MHLMSGSLSAFAIWQIGKVLPALANPADNRWPLILGLLAMVATAAPTSLRSFLEIVKGIKK